MADRDNLIRQLSSYNSSYQEELGFKRRFLELIEQHANCFDRRLLHAHITGSGWVIDATGHFALMIHHAKLDRWLQLGGHADGDANVNRVALREVMEESGLRSVQPLKADIFDLDIHVIPERGAEPEHEHFDIRYLFMADRTEKIKRNEESREVSWIPLDRLDELTQSNRSILRMAEKTSHIKGKVSSLW